MSMMSTAHRINAVANIATGAALVAATIIGAIAVALQDWHWWQVGLTWCLMLGLWGFFVSAIATNSQEFKAAKRIHEQLGG